jgi:spermidine synthase
MVSIDTVRKAQALHLVSAFCLGFSSLVLENAGFRLAYLAHMPGALGAGLTLSTFLLGFYLGALGLVSKRFFPAPLFLTVSACLQLALFNDCFPRTIFNWPLNLAWPVLVSVTLNGLGAGLTLPSLLLREEKNENAQANLIYLANNVGALLGSTFMGFAYLTLGGFNQAIAIAITCNVIALSGSKKITTAISDKTKAYQKNREEYEEAPASIRLLAFLGGLLFLFYENLSLRLGAIVLGDNSFTQATILTLALAGLSLGSTLVQIGRLSFPFCQNLVLLCLVLILPAQTLISNNSLYFHLCLATGFLALGLYFPSLTRQACLRGYRRAYVFSCLGALCAPCFFLMVIKISALLKISAVSLSAQILLLLILISLAPRNFRRLKLQGLAPILILFSSLTLWQGKPGLIAEETLVFQEDGYLSRIEVSCLERENLLFLKNNGKTEATIPLDLSKPAAGSDLTTHRLLYLLPERFLPPGIRSTLIIGLGSGSTAATAWQANPEQKLLVLELDELVKSAAQFFPLYRSQMADLEKHIKVIEARQWLAQAAPESYSLIISQPCEPYITGSSHLYTQEFYQLIKSRLTADGIFTQWMQLYDLKEEAMLGLLATMQKEFPGLLIFHPAHSGEVIVLLSKDKALLTQEKLLKNVADLPANLQLSKLWAECNLFSTRSLSESIILEGNNLKEEKLRAFPLNTQLHPYLELTDESPKNQLEQIQTNLAALQGLAIWPTPLPTKPEGFLAEPYDQDLKLLKAQIKLEKFLENFDKKELKEGHNVLQEAYLISGNRCALWQIKALLDLSNCQFDECAQSIIVAHKLSPNEAGNYITATLLSAVKGEKADAYANLNKLKQKDPKNAILGKLKVLLATTKWESQNTNTYRRPLRQKPISLEQKQFLQKASPVIRAVAILVLQESSCN